MIRDYNLIIIGGGIAGVTAAIYGKRGGLNVIVFEPSLIGGLLNTTDSIENYTGFSHITGEDFSIKMEEQLKYNNIKISKETVIEIIKINNCFTVITNKNTYHSIIVIYCTGSTPKKLGLSNESSSNISTCAVCDGNLYSNKIVAVIGGGNSAIEEALYLSSICKNVYLIYRKPCLKGEQITIDQVNNTSNIIKINNTIITQFIKEDNNNIITSINKKNILTLEEIILPIDGVFIAIGHDPNINLSKNLVTLSKFNTINNKDGITKTEGFFVCGDVQDHQYRQAITAAASGCIAALNGLNYWKLKRQ